MEVVLQRSSHDGVLNLVECQVSAKRFYIEGNAFSAALSNTMCSYITQRFFPRQCYQIWYLLNCLLKIVLDNDL